MKRQPLSKRSVEAYAIGFRRRYFPRAEGPIDIEPVLEHELKIIIDPRWNITRDLGTRGWLAVDGQTIVVDAQFQLDDEREYIALLGHEAAHVDLHSQLLPRERTFSSYESFVAYHEGLGEVSVVQLELEARQWGMYVLMPTAELLPVFWEAVEKARDRFPRLAEAARSYISHVVGAHFQVTTLRADYRIRMEALWGRLRMEDSPPSLRKLEAYTRPIPQVGRLR